MESVISDKDIATCVLTKLCLCNPIAGILSFCPTFADVVPGFLGDLIVVLDINLVVKGGVLAVLGWSRRRPFVT
jgi:hypothetical protein